MENRGVEPAAFLCGNRPVSGQGGAVDGKNVPIAADLASVTEAWDSLAPDTRATILAIVERVQGR